MITKVLGIKENGSQKFLIVDAGMNDLMRPSLYSARHKIENLVESSEKKDLYSVVGPVCETADSFGSISRSVQMLEIIWLYIQQEPMVQVWALITIPDLSLLKF